MSIKDQIRAEIERMREINKKAFKAEHIREGEFLGRTQAVNHLSAFLYSLPEQPDFPTTDEQIKEFLATHPKIKVPEKYKNPDWLLKKPEQPVEGLEEEMDEMWLEYCEDVDYLVYASIARHFAEWGMNQCPLPEDTTIFLKGVAEGKRLMMEEAVEGYVNYYEDAGGILMAEAQVGCPYHNGDKVKIIIVKENEK